LVIMAVYLSLSASAGVQVDVDQDPETNFDDYRTIAWREGTEAGRPQVEKMIVKAVERELAELGFRRVDGAGADADLYVTTTTMANIDSHIGGSAFNSDYYNIGLITADVVATTKGVLMVELLDGKSELPVWRGLASETMSLPDFEKIRKKVNKVVKKMFNKYPSR
jgi:hypothetical protein